MSDDWVVYVDLEEFKDYFWNWIDHISDEGLTEDSKVLGMKKDGSLFFNFRDIVLRHPDDNTIQDLLIQIENIEPPDND